MAYFYIIPSLPTQNMIILHHLLRIFFHFFFLLFIQALKNLDEHSPETNIFGNDIEKQKSHKVPEQKMHSCRKIIIVEATSWVSFQMTIKNPLQRLFLNDRTFISSSLGRHWFTFSFYVNNSLSKNLARQIKKASRGKIN